MTADVLRQAANLMRERATAASPSPWVQTVWPKEIPGVYSQAIEDSREFDPEIARTLDKPDAEHIASWHPEVALAVADWLDDTAPLMRCDECGMAEFHCLESRGTKCCPDCGHGRKAMAVARAYLNTP